jgi:hypothetical protein
MVGKPDREGITGALAFWVVVVVIVFSIVRG